MDNDLTCASLDHVTKIKKAKKKKKKKKKKKRVLSPYFERVETKISKDHRFDDHPTLAFDSLVTKKKQTRVVSPYFQLSGSNKSQHEQAKNALMFAIHDHGRKKKNRVISPYFG